MRRLLLLALAVEAATAGAPSARAARPHLQLTGPEVISEARVRHEVGRPPRRRSRLEKWLEDGAAEVRELYRTRGYAYVRVVHAVDEDGDPMMHVDEGRMARIELVGSRDLFRYIFLDAELGLPGGVFHTDTLIAGIHRLEARLGVSGIRWRVVDGDLVSTPVGKDIPERILQIILPRGQETGGWGFTAETDARYGVKAGVGGSLPAAIADGDWLEAQVEIALPFTRLVLEEESRFQWVHGLAELHYFLPELGDSGLIPRLDATLALSWDGRTDLGIERALALRTVAVAGFTWRLTPEASLNFGAGLSHLVHLEAQPTPDWRGKLPVTPGFLRADVRLSASWVERGFFRRHLRSRFGVWTRLSLTGSGEVMVDAIAKGVLTKRHDGHYLIARFEAWTQHLDVRFWDERNLAGGGTFRSYTDPVTWLRHAGIVELAYRAPIVREDFMMGAFVDVAAFPDPDRPGKLGLATAIGPSAHLVLFRFLTIDAYMAVGFTPRGLDTQFTFKIRNLY